MKSFRFIGHFLAINLLLLGFVNSQSPITFSTKLGIEDGLIDREISKIDRDEYGYFWLLKDNIIQRYDGKYFGLPIDHPVQNPKYFASLDEARLLLISQGKEAFIISKTDNNYANIKIPSSIKKGNKLLDIHYTDDSLFYIFEHQGNVVTYLCDLNSKEFAFTSVFSARLPVQIDVKSIFFSDNIYLICDTSQKFYLLDSNHISKIDLGTPFREQEVFSFFQKVKDNELYFSLPKQRGAFLYKNDSIIILDNFSNLSFVKEDSKGNVLAGLTNRDRFTEQILLVDHKGIRQEWYELMAIDDTFTDVHGEDFNHQLLLGSYTGLYYVKLQNRGIKKTHLSSKPKGEFGNVIMSFNKNDSGEIYYVKEAGGVYQYTGGDPDVIAEDSEVVYNLHSINHSNEIWTGGYTAESGGILYNIEPSENTIQSWDIEQPIYYIYPSNDNQLLLLTGSNSTSNILRFDIQKKMVVDTFLPLTGERARKIEQLSDSTFLVGTSKRLFTYNSYSGAITNLLQETNVRTFYIDKDHYLVGTIGKGLFVFDKTFTLKKIVNKNTGLGNNIIYCIEKDRNGYFWLGTNYGINVIDSTFLPFRDFNMNDGVSNYEFNSQAVIRMRNGNLLFGTINGVTEINTEVALSAPISERAIIPTIEYKLKDVLISQNITSGSVEISSLAKDLNMIVKVNDYYISSTPGKISLYKVNVNPSKSQFMVTNNSILFPKVKESKTVVCLQPKSIQNNIPSYTIVIKKITDLKFLYAGLLLFLGISAVSLFISRKIIAQNRKRESEKKEFQIKMAELELQALRSQMNPHFIFNSLGAILHYIQTNDKKKAEKYLTKFAKLMRLFLESSKSKFISFEEEVELLQLYLQLEKLRFEDKFNYHFDIDDRIDMHNLVLPSMLLQPFIENAINHGLYHKKGNDGLLTITAIPDNDTVKVIIEDNGVGREAARIIRENSLKKHKSRAAEIIQERINVLKQQKNIDIDFSYIDLVDKNGKPSGTKVIISIPKIIKEL